MSNLSKKDLQKTFTLHLLSDATGETLYHMAQSISTQFPKDSLKPKIYSFLSNEASLEKALNKIQDGIVAHGIVSKKLKEIINQYCKKKNIPCSDWTKPLAEFLEEATGLTCSQDPNLLHPLDSNYMDRINALEFTIEHDDGRNLYDINSADIILVGISRVSKTPSSIYLAMKGYKVANVSLISINAIPKELDESQQENIVGLTIQPKRLSEIRKRRIESLGGNESPYTELKDVIREVMEFESYYRKKDWPIIDITNQTVEETATLVLKEIKREKRS